jgi:hypothetical protein
MSDDLVKDLRNSGWYLAKPAADRIEKLEAALRYYAKEYENPFGGDDSLIASKALEGKDE